MKDDTISRQEAINAVHKEFDKRLIWDERGRATANEVEKILEELPAAQPQRIKGQWIHDGYDHPHGVDWIHCSACGRYRINVPADLTNFCPFCGADMRDDINRIVKEILHTAIDNGVWAEDAYPNIKERLHKTIDEYEVKEE